MQDRLVEFRAGGWLVRAAPEHQELAGRLAQLSPLPQAVRLLRDDYRSYVGVLEVDGRLVVAKSSRLKNRGGWSRLITLLRPGEAASTLRACLHVRRHAIPVPEYICALERRSRGMIVDSWMFYFFIEAAPCVPEHYPLVLQALARLHRIGWVHGDPHIANFLWNDAGVHLIDCRPHLARLGRLSECYDFVRLANSRPAIATHLHSISRTRAYRIAAAYDRAVHRWRNLKRTVRAGIGRPRLHLAEAGFVCRLCGGNDLRLYYSQGNDRRYRFYRCQRCRLVNYDLSAGLNQEKYGDAFTDPLDVTHRHNRGQTATWTFVLSRIRRTGRLLDIGCGNGRILHLARQDGWHVQGLELSAHLTERVHATLGVPVEVSDFLLYDIRQSNVAQEGFDLVLLRHVLEHLPDPILAMEKIRGLLRPGGYAVLEFPNIDALDLRLKRVLEKVGLKRKRYAADYMPGHCNEYCRESFIHLLERAGFDLECWTTYSLRPLENTLYRLCPWGNKARALIRRRSDEGTGVAGEEGGAD